MVLQVELQNLSLEQPFMFMESSLQVQCGFTLSFICFVKNWFWRPLSNAHCQVDLKTLAVGKAKEQRFPEMRAHFPRH